MNANPKNIDKALGYYMLGLIILVFAIFGGIALYQHYYQTSRITEQAGGCPQLCATPSSSARVECWSRNTLGVITATQKVKGGQPYCCPAGSGSFTVNGGVQGSYTGRSQSCSARPFETLITGAYGGEIW